ncbi:hypothetical protein EV363DRAFT_1413059 [Boletus edulis]|nr:hypothetical protein EV363DRAFT_1413059 [Boletus edulis]
MAAPVAQEELPILEAVINIRNRLTALKRDRADFIKPSAVNALYQAVVKQVTKLNDIREDNNSTSCNNRVDTTLADVFSLLSLCYLTLGRTKECPAVYSQLASMRTRADPIPPLLQQILTHMEESGHYNESDLAPFHRRLDELRAIVQHDAESGKHLSLQDSLSEISVELIPTHDRLITLRRQLVTLAAKEGSHKTELKPLAEELRKIDSLSIPKRVDGKFLGPGGIVPASQAVCSSLLEDCFDILQQIKAQDESKNVATSLKPIHDRLSQLRSELENLVLTHRWSLRETDLYNYSLSLQEIDKMRIDGKFVEADGNRPPGQYVLLYLLRRCYGLIYRLLSSSEPVSEELMPIVRPSSPTRHFQLKPPIPQANKLSTVKKCLNEVCKHGGPFSPRDLYPYQLALHQIDSMRKDGKFVGHDGSVPEGQGIVMAHLNECHELLEMLKESMEENDQFDEDEDEDQLDEASNVAG